MLVTEGWEISANRQKKKNVHNTRAHQAQNRERGRPPLPPLLPSLSLSYSSTTMSEKALPCGLSTAGSTSSVT
jgi:hypothetical protein